MADRNPGLFDHLHPKVDSLSEWLPSRKTSLVRLAFEAGGDNLYDYAIPDALEGKLAKGQRIAAPFGKGNRPQIGFCVDFPARAEVERVKSITEAVEEKPLLTEHMLDLAEWIAQYYCCSLGAVLAAMVPAAVKKQIGLEKKTYISLTEAGREEFTLPQRRLSQQGRMVITFLAGQEAPSLELSGVLRAGNCTRATALTLQRLGLVALSQRREFSTPRHGDLPREMVPQINLNADQETVLKQILAMIEQTGFHTALLHGVTGSGKTEIYIRAIEQVIKNGGQALVLVPEIALTPQTVSRFLGRFERVAVLHSALTATQRHQQWRLIADGQAEVVVGARSAVFAPLPLLKLIVVDEEHEPSYKQDTTPRYHGRDVAIKQAHMLGIPVILGSATPSLESWQNCRRLGHYQLLSLPRRVLELPLPPVHIVDMREEMTQRKGEHLLSLRLEQELGRCLKEKHQAILLLNRRGHSNYVFCPSCRFVLSCPNCDVSLTYHKRKETFATAQRSWVMCHYCQHTSEVRNLCPVCGKKMILIGPGTQKAEEELARKFPTARIRRMDSDAVRPGEYGDILKAFGAGEIDILMGTQMIGKGLDYPNVRLVGVINADTALSLPDFRSSERTFQLIAQVAGRCGRASNDGKVIVQSFMPDEPSVKLACDHDYQRFAEQELQTRQRCEMPPFARLARILLRDSDLEKLEASAKQLRGQLDAINAQGAFEVKLRGPAPAAIARLENYHRIQILLQATRAEQIQSLLAQARTDVLSKLAVQAIVDVDPVNLL